MGATSLASFKACSEKNTLTFNPGWDSDASKLEAFTDVRALQRQLKAQGVQLLLKPTRERPAPPASSRLTQMGTPSW